MKTKPYQYRNKEYNRSCCLCGKVGNGVNKHIGHAIFIESWLVRARKEAGMPVKDEEIVHLNHSLI